MASQVAHVIYAKKLFDALENSERIEKLRSERKLSLPEPLDKDQFLLGATFPDIRRIDRTIRRKDTHLRFEPLDLDFSGLSSFESGWKFHLFCDMRREEILNALGFYSLSGSGEFYSLPSKLLEDSLVYGEYNNWEKIVAYFRNPPFIESGIGVGRETFSLWYAILAKYFEELPNIRTMRVFMGKQSGLPGSLDEVAASVEKLEKSKKAGGMLLKIKEDIV